MKIVALSSAAKRLIKTPLVVYMVLSLLQKLRELGHRDSFEFVPSTPLMRLVLKSHLLTETAQKPPGAEQPTTEGLYQLPLSVSSTHNALGAVIKSE